MDLGLHLRLGTALTGSFSPLSLFSAGEQGAWYDPSDFSTMFQNTAGTTPVTAAGQQVGLLLDKSQGLVLGPELVTNGDFSSGTGWTLETGWSISGGQASGTGLSGGGTARIYQSAPSVVGRTYAITYTATAATGTGFSLFTGTSGPPTTAGAFRDFTGTFTEYVVAAGSTLFFGIGGRGTGPSTVTIDNVSVKLLPGNHATQATSAQRPTLGRNPVTGTRNLLTFTEQFDNAVWVLGNGGVGLVPTRTLSAGTSPSGVTACRLQLSLNGGTTATDISSFRQSVTLAAAAHTYNVWMRSFDGTSSYVLQLTDVAGVATNITVTGTWQRFSVTGTASGGAVNLFVRLRGGQTPTNSNTADILFSEPQLETGSTATAYQRVVSAFDVTQAGVADAWYLSCDGTDDGMVTNTITPGIDKAQVFAGVRKLSDAAGGMLVELSPGSGSGRFETFAPIGAGAQNYYFSTGGTLFAPNTVTTYAAPITNVLTGIGDIGADVSVVRINGAQVASNSANQGTGNYLAYPLYIGRRGGTSNPFNGRIYGLAVRFGANLTAAQITQMETWMNGKTGAY